MQLFACVHSHVIRGVLCGRATFRTGQALLLCWPILVLAACATASRPGGPTRGYTEVQIGRNLFVVGLEGNPHGPATTTTQLCLLRCAETTLAYGFSHFVVLENSTEPASSAPRMISTRLPSGGVSFVSSQGSTPSSTNTIACFRKQPTQYPEAYDAKGVFESLSHKYGARKGPEARANVMEVLPVQFDLYPIFLFLTKTTPDQIVFLDISSPQRTIVIGGLTEWENPCQTLAEFKARAAVAAATVGGQAIQIQEGLKGAGFRGSQANSPFSADLLLVPKARLGLRDEAGDWPRNEPVLRGFDERSLAPQAGLKVGDRIIELNGVDVLQPKRFVDAWLSWAVGDDVVVTFLRDGTEMTLQVKTIAN